MEWMALHDNTVEKKCEGCFDRKKEGQGQDKAGAGEH